MSLLQEITIEPQDRRLLKAFAGTGLVIMAIGGLFALLMVLERTPAIPISSPTLYYRSLTGHGIFMFFFWLCFVQTAFLIAAGTVLIKRRLWSYPLAWVGFGVMVAAAIISAIGILLGADITYSATVPLAEQYSAAWLVYLGFIVLSVGLLIVVADFIATIFAAVQHPFSFNSWVVFLRDIPISTFAAVAGLFIVIPGLIATLKTFIPAFLWSVGLGSIDPMSYRMSWHIAFHIYHYVPALTLVGVAYILVELTADATSVYAKQVAKALFLLYPFFVPPTFLYHLLVDPTISQTIKFIGTALSLLVGVPTVLHMFIILGMLEARMRRAGYGVFGWVRHLPWSNPAFGSMIMGMVTLLVGGLFSYIIIQEQLAPMLHNTFVVPAYVHAMAAGGANIIYMGFLFYGIPILMGRQLWGLGLARIQPYLMAGALLIMSVAGVAAGLAGVPRRFPSISGGDTPASWAPLMNLSLGVGGMLATAALILFILIMGMTAIAGKRVATSVEAIKGMEPPHLPLKVEYDRTPVALIPSTLFLVGVIFLTLVAFGLFRGMPIQTH
jgi:cytochrome c oxidase subunit 1